MKDKINTYIATLLITIAGAGATLLIVHVVFANTFPALAGGESQYAPLQKTLLNEK